MEPEDINFIGNVTNHNGTLRISIPKNIVDVLSISDNDKIHLKLLKIIKTD